MIINKDYKEDYITGEEIGGGQAKIYKAKEKKNQNQEKAIKIYTYSTNMDALNENSEEFKEFKINQKLNHENIIKAEKAYYQFDKKQNNYKIAFVIESCDQSLEQLISKKIYENIEFKQQQYFSDYQIILWMLQALEGYKTLVDQKNNQRDVRPTNIMVKKAANNFTLKITDLGFKPSSKEAELSQNADSNVLLAYKAPEYFTITNEDSLSFNKEQQDIFSLGLIFLQTCLLKPVNQIGKLNQRKSGQLEILKILQEITNPVIRITLQVMLTHQKENRFKTFSQTHSFLKWLLSIRKVRSCQQIFKQIQMNKQFMTKRVYLITEFYQIIKLQLELDTQKKLFKKQIDTINKELNTQIEQLQEQNQDLDKKNQNLEDKNKELTKQLQANKNQSQSSENLSKEFSQKFDNFSKEKQLEVDNLQQQISSLKNQISLLEKQNKEQQSQIQSQKTQIEDLSKKKELESSQKPVVPTDNTSSKTAESAQQSNANKKQQQQDQQNYFDNSQPNKHKNDMFDDFNINNKKKQEAPQQHDNKPAEQSQPAKQTDPKDDKKKEQAKEDTKKKGDLAQEIADNKQQQQKKDNNPLPDLKQPAGKSQQQQQKPKAKDDFQFEEIDDEDDDMFFKLTSEKDKSKKSDLQQKDLPKDKKTSQDSGNKVPLFEDEKLEQSQKKKDHDSKKKLQKSLEEELSSKKKEFLYDFEADDDDFDQEEFKKQLEQDQKNLEDGDQIDKGQQEKSSAKSNDIDYDIDEEINEELIKREMQKQLMITNEYVKKTKFAQKDQKIDLREANSIDSIIILFEEFIHQGSCFFFQMEQCDALLEVVLRQMQGEEVDEDFQAIMQDIQSSYYQITQQIEFDPTLKLYFGFSDNPWNIQMIELNPLTLTISVFLLTKLKKEMEESFQPFVEFLVSIFNKTEGFKVNAQIIDPASMQIIEQYQELPYIPYLVSLFSIVYENKQDEAPQIVFNQETLERLQYILSAQKGYYSIMQGDGQELEQFYSTLLKEFEKDKEITVIYKQYTKFNELFDAIFKKEITNATQLLTKDPAKKHILMLVEIQLEEFKFSYYINISKGDKSTEIGVFMLENYGEFNEKIYEILLPLDNEKQRVRPVQDYSRHNGLYEFNTHTLALWGYLIKKKGLTPNNAIYLLNFSLIPYYLISQKLE